MSLMKIVNTLCNNPNLSELYLNDNKLLNIYKEYLINYTWSTGFTPI